MSSFDIIHCKECGNYKADGEACPANKALCPHLGDWSEEYSEDNTFQGNFTGGTTMPNDEFDNVGSEFIESDDVPTIAINNYETNLGPDPGTTLPANVIDDDPATQVYINDRFKKAQPVTGWLVCIEGPSFGQDYKLYMQNNSVGRGSARVVIDGDDNISRGSHAIITYDPEDNVYVLRPGEQTGITRLNGKRLDVPTELNPFDKIKLGTSILLFVPCCSDAFQWPAEAMSEEA